MSWLVPKFVSDYWVPDQPPPTATVGSDDEFTVIDRELDPPLSEAIASHLPNKGQDFQAALANRFSLTLIGNHAEEGPTKIWLVNLTNPYSSSKTMVLRITRVEDLKATGTEDTFFDLNGPQGMFGVEWCTFLPEAPSLPRPEAAVAWNHTHEKFEVLTQEQITSHHSGVQRLNNHYTLYATLSPHIANGNAPYIHSMFDSKTHKTLSPFIPARESNLFRLTLATILRDLKVVKPLGEGSFSQVWQVTFTDIDNTTQTMALKLAKTESIGDPSVLQKCFQISRGRFGGEFGAFLPEGPYILSSFYAIVWDEGLSAYRLIGREEINGYHNKPLSIGTNVLTLYGTLSECHEGAQTLEALMESETTLDVETIKNYAYQLLLGLAEFPEGMIHRDLKPSNILVTSAGVVKILDFGFSAVGAGMAHSTLGTPLLMSPEVHKQTPYGQKADLYSLFCIFFKMATGEYPITATTFSELKAKMSDAIAQGNDPKDDSRLQRFDAGFRQFLSRLGHTRPGERWTLNEILQKDCFLQSQDTSWLQNLSYTIPKLIPTSTLFSGAKFLRSASNYFPSYSSLKGRTQKLLILGGATFVLYQLARRAFILWTKPQWKTPSN